MKSLPFQKHAIGSIFWAEIWVYLCVFLNLAAWVLSFCGWLNRTGYLYVFAVLFICLILCRKRKLQGQAGCIRKLRFSRWRRRIKRQPVFLIFLLFALAALVGGLIYAPANHDNLSYRMPRILNWLWEGKWHWIDAPADLQINTSTVGFEFLSTFLFALFQSDRLLFLPNLISFLLLPGLFFSSAIQLGVSKRIASWWMWIFPCGAGFALQAGSAGNDLPAVPYFLVALICAIRFSQTGSRRFLVLCILASALLTGIKLSNAPLVLPIAIAALWNWKQIGRKHLLPAIPALVVGAAVSALPIAIICQIQTGHFSGDPDNETLMQLDDPVAGVVGNSLQVVSRNMMPPLNPVAGTWNQTWPNLVPDWLFEEYPRVSLEWSEFPQEESNGLGLGLVILLVIGLCAFERKSRSIFVRVVVWSGVLALLVYMAKLGSEAAPRLLLPYYVILIFLLIANIRTQLLRTPFWKWTSTLCCLLIGPAILLSPSRPLIPVQFVLNLLPESSQTNRARQVYAAYENRNQNLATLRDALPDTVTTVGFIGERRSLRLALWQPFGSRKVIYLPPGAHSDDLAEFDALVVDFEFLNAENPDSWVRERRLIQVFEDSVVNRIRHPVRTYVLFVRE